LPRGGGGESSSLLTSGHNAAGRDARCILRERAAVTGVRRSATAVNDAAPWRALPARRRFELLRQKADTPDVGDRNAPRDPTGPDPC